MILKILKIKLIWKKFIKMMNKDFYCQNYSGLFISKSSIYLLYLSGSFSNKYFKKLFDDSSNSKDSILER
jgi:hypothetical protein